MKKNEKPEQPKKFVTSPGLELPKSNSLSFDPWMANLVSENNVRLSQSLAAPLSNALTLNQEMVRLTDSLTKPAFTNLLDDLNERTSLFVSSVPPPTLSIPSNTLLDTINSITTPWVNAAESISSFSRSLNETIDKTRSSLVFVNGTIQSIKDANAIVGNAFTDLDYPFTKLKESTLNLSTMNSFASLAPNTDLSLSLKSVDDMGGGGIRLHSSALRQVTYPEVQLTSSAEIRVFAQLERVEEKQDELTRKVSELIELYKSGKSDLLPARIKEFIFDAHNSILTIKGVKIFIRPSTKQSALCNRLLNADDVSEKVILDDLIEEIGEWPDSVDIDQYRKQFYQAVRHLNDKICQKTGLEQFIMQSNTSYWINADYLDLFS